MGDDIAWCVATTVFGTSGCLRRNECGRPILVLPNLDKQTAAKVLASVQEARTPAMRAMLADAASTELPASIARYPGPVLVLAAPGEPTLGELRPGVEVRRLSIESHWSTLDSAAEVNEALRDFVRPLRAERLGAVRPGTADSLGAGALQRGGGR